MANIVKGLMHQLTMRVRRTGRALLPAATTSAKSIFTMIGYIMKNRQIAIGMDTTGAPPTSRVMPSRERARPGARRPSVIPAIMQRRTQTVRRRSNPSIRRSFLDSSPVASVWVSVTVVVSLSSREA
jgi:hypothetical protein